MKWIKLMSFAFCLSTIFSISTFHFKAVALTNEEKQTNGVAYETDFENMNISGTSTVDKNTGFIWANDWQNTKTVKRNDSNMLDISVYDSATYSTIGGFGIGDKSNLANCKIGEPYHVSTYFEMQNIDFVFVEFVGGSNKWGSVRVYPNGDIKANAGGNNISNVTYVDHILQFNFTMSYNQDEKMNGYIKFTAYHATSAHVYLDDVSICEATHMIQEDYEHLPLGEFDSHSADLHTNFYVEGSTKSSFVKENDNTIAKMSFTLSQNNAGESIFFLNKLGFLNTDRQYEMTFDLMVNNVDELWIYHGGTWMNPPSYVKINFSQNSLLFFGDVIQTCTFENKKLIMKFNTNHATGDWMQFQFVAKVKEANIESNIMIDNLTIFQEAIVSQIYLDVSSVKTKYNYGESFDASNLKVTALYSNDQKKEVDVSKCSLSGFDPYGVGKQKITVTYENVSATYEITVKRDAVSIIINENKLKKEYNYGEEIDLSNLEVRAVYFSMTSSEEYVSLLSGAAKGGYSIDLGGFDSHRPDNYIITIYYKNVKKTFAVVVKPASKIEFDGITYQKTEG